LPHITTNANTRDTKGISATLPIEIDRSLEHGQRQD
jgi:hypothetical protein